MFGICSRTALFSALFLINATAVYAACDATMDRTSLSACLDHEDRERMNSNAQRNQEIINQSIDHINGGSSSPGAVEINRDYQIEQARQRDRAQQEQQKRYEEEGVMYIRQAEYKLKQEATTDAGIGLCLSLRQHYVQQNRADTAEAFAEMYGCLAERIPELPALVNPPAATKWEPERLRFYVDLVQSKLTAEVVGYLRAVISGRAEAQKQLGARYFEVINRETARKNTAEQLALEAQRKAEEAESIKFGEIESLRDFSEGLARVCYREKGCGFVDTKGQLVIAARPGKLGEKFSGGLVAAEDASSHLMGFMNAQGEMAIAATYAWTSTQFSEGLAAVTFPPDAKGDAAGVGFIDTKGQTVIAPQRAWRSPGIFRNGLAPVFNGDLNQYVWIDPKGEVALSTEKNRYRYVRALPQGYEVCMDMSDDQSLGTQCGFMSLRGKMLLPAKFNGARYAAEDLFIVPVQTRSGPCRYVTDSGKDAFKGAPVFDGCTAYAGERALVRKTPNNRMESIDLRGRSPDSVFAFVESADDCDDPDAQGYWRCRSVWTFNNGKTIKHRVALLHRRANDDGEHIDYVISSDDKPALTGYWFINTRWTDMPAGYAIAAIDPVSGILVGSMPSNWLMAQLTDEMVISLAKDVRKEKGVRLAASFYGAWESRDNPKLLTKIGEMGIRAGDDCEDHGNEVGEQAGYYDRAWRVLYRAAEQNHPAALFYVGRRQLNWKNSDATRKKGAEKMLAAAKLGDTDAMIEVAKMYSREEPFLTHNPVKSFKWYLKSAEAGNAEAMKQVADCYRRGDGVQEDQDAAAKWEQAAKDAE